MERGYVSMMGSPMGRRAIITLNHEIVGFIVQRKMQQATISGESLRKEIQRNYGAKCSRRSIPSKNHGESSFLEIGGRHRMAILVEYDGWVEIEKRSYGASATTSSLEYAMSRQEERFWLS